jgi:hypothetical protein
MKVPGGHLFIPRLTVQQKAVYPPEQDEAGPHTAE